MRIKPHLLICAALFLVACEKSNISTVPKIIDALIGKGHAHSAESVKLTDEIDVLVIPSTTAGDPFLALRRNNNVVLLLSTFNNGQSIYIPSDGKLELLVRTNNSKGENGTLEIIRHVTSEEGNEMMLTYDKYGNISNQPKK